MDGSLTAHTVRDPRMVFGQLEADLTRLRGCPEADGAGGTPGRISRVPPVFYLGYPLYLSPDECSLVLALLEAAVGNDRQPGGWVAASLLRSRLGLSKNQIAVHILRVNHKAAEIGGRRLVAGHKNKGYRLNPYM
mgnify:CR=1 FL=1